MKINSNVLFIIFVILATCGEVGGDILFKNGISTQGSSKIWLFVMGFAVYSVGAGFWLLTLLYKEISIAIIVISILNFLVVILLGLLYYKETLTPLQFVGLGLGAVAIVLLLVGEK